MSKANKEFTPRDYFHIAVLIGAHGIKGECRAKLLSDETDLANLKKAFLLSPAEDENRAVKFKAKPHKNVYIVQFDHIRNREDAEALKGHYIAVGREQARALPEGRYYTADLVGCNVYVAGRGMVGTLKDTISSPGADIFEVVRPGMKDLLVPILEDTLIEVNIDTREIHLQLAEGLWEIYD